MTDPRVTIVYFSIVLIVFALAAAAWETYTDWRDRVEQERTDRRVAILIDRYTRNKTEAPDRIPDWMMDEKKAA